MRIILACALAGILAVPAKADEVLQFRFVSHRIALTTQVVGDVDGHAMGLFRNSGLVSFRDQSVGSIYWTGTYDYVKSVGPYLAYVNLTLSDGSILWYKVAGSARPDRTPMFMGSVSVLGGKGRFEGAKGDGTITGTVVNTDGDQYGDHIINVKK